MKTFEYVSIQLAFTGLGKGIKIMQYGEASLLSLSSRKKLLKSREHFDIFNAAIGLLGAHQGGSILCLISIHQAFVREISDTFQNEAIKYSRRNAFFGCKVTDF